MPLHKKLRRRISYLPTFFSISLVLFLLGVFGWFMLNVNILKEEVRENVPMRIFLKEEAQAKDVNKLQKELEARPYVRKATYVSKEAGLKSLQDEYDVDAEEILGYNPLPNSIDVNFKSEYIQADSLLQLKAGLENHVVVREVYYNKMLVQDIDKNVRIVGIVVLSFALLMGAVSIALINNTIRLTLYSKRFLIKSMQLVGATRNFIRKPFIIKGSVIGLLSSIFACILIAAALYIFTKYFPELKLIQNYTQLAALFAGIIVLGIFISSISSYFAINKYLKMKLDDLF
ncbi:MAG: cell division protein FtsX [Bacteroidia bacterium]